METSFVRKFILKELPALPKISSELNSRYYLYCKGGSVIRVQSRNGEYEIEKKKDIDGIKKESQRISIDEEEFKLLSKFSKFTILRETLQYKNLPNYKIRVYKGQFKGLLRVEVSFKSLLDLNNYAPLSWFGSEISKTPLAKDESLLGLSNSEFHEHLQAFLKKG